MVPKVLVRSSQTMVKSPFLILASCIIWLRTPVCSRHPAKPEIPPLWIEVLRYPLSIMYEDILFATTEKKILHSVLSKEF